MKLLLDTHALVWWWVDDPRLPAGARAAIAATANTVFVSAATAWEIASRHRIGKWPEVERLIGEFSSHLRRSRFIPLPVSIEHARLAGGLDIPHRDPFDRMLIAQSREEKATLVSADGVFAAAGLEVIWA